MTARTIDPQLAIGRASSARSQAQLRISGILLFGLAAQFMTVIMLGASMAPGYDIAHGAISDLGVIDQSELLFNASLVVVGALNLAAGFLL